MGFVIQFLYVMLLKFKKTPLVIDLIVYLILYWPVHHYSLISIITQSYYPRRIIIDSFPLQMLLLRSSGRSAAW